MGDWASQLPAIAMVSMQFVYSILALMTRVALVKGMSPRVYIFYRQAIGTFIIFPIAYFSRRKSSKSSKINAKSFTLIFAAAFIGVAFNQNVYFEGMYLSSSSIATAMTNLVPGITFLIAAFARMEQVKLRKLSSVAKIVGTCFCVGGAASMVLLRGPKLLNSQFPPTNSILLHSLEGGDETWLLGCLFLFVSACCWSFWLILQVPITECYPDHLSLCAWTCAIATLQSGVIALLLERDSKAWAFSSLLELACCFYAGIMGSALQIVVQAWCISRKGPLFSAMFSPLATVITTVLASAFFNEEIYMGSLLGGVTVIIGLYVVLWGKAEEIKERLHSSLEESPSKTAHDKSNSNNDLEQPLLLEEN